MIESGYPEYEVIYELPSDEANQETLATLRRE